MSASNRLESLSPRDLLERIGAHSTNADVVPLLEHPDTDETHVLALLRKRELPAGVIETVSKHERWSRRHKVREAIVSHTKAPKTLAMRLLPLLLWREQLRVASNNRLSMPLRASAEKRLKERLPELELGEKVSLARSAPHGLLPALGGENDALIVQAMLLNPRLREMDVIVIVRRDQTSAEVLRAVCRSERWIHRPEVQLAVVRHRNTPVHEALTVLSRVPKRRLQELVRKRELPPVVAKRAEKLLSP